MTTQDVSDAFRRVVVDRTQRNGSVRMVLVVALVLIVAALGLLFVGRSQAEPYILMFLATLATVGVFSLFATAAGLLRLPGKELRPSLISAIVDTAIDSIVVTDGSGRVIYANLAYLALVEASDPNDIRPVERVFIGDPDVSEAVYRLVKAAREGRTLQEEVRVLGAEGHAPRWLRFRVRPFGSGRDARNTIWTVTDVTRDRERQENVFQELQYAIDYLDHAPAGFFSVDAQGDIVYVNATLAGWLGLDIDRAGSGALRLADIISGDGAALLLGLPASAGAVRTEVFDLDLKTRDSRTLPVRMFHKVAFGADGRPGPSRTLVLNRARDETGDPQRAAEVRFVRFFNNTPLAIATVDRSGRILRTNAPFARFRQGLLKADSPQEGHSILAVVVDADRPKLETAISRAGQGQGEIPPVDAALASDHRSAKFWVSGIEEAEPDGEAAIVYALETTEQRRLEAQLGQSQKMQAVGQLAGGIAHDFNNVLSVIMMATDFLLNAHKPSDPSFQDIMQIRQNANRAAAWVRQLLAFSRRQRLHPEVLDLGEVLSDLANLLRRLLGEKVSLELMHGRDLWAVKADISQFEQVVMNLAVNARDAMPEGGKVVIKTTNVNESDCASFGYLTMPPADYVLVEVIDTGTGIPADIIDKIFEPFFSTKDVGKGTGLGLSTVYGIVKQTGGFIFLESTVGAGTTFRIFLPRYVAGAQVADAPQADASAEEATLVPAIESAAPARKPATDLTGVGTILLVEDEEALRALNARGLSSRGYTVLEAANGVEALRVLDECQNAVDLVVSDVVMPEMDGPTLLKQLRKRNPELKVIFVSGYAEDAFEKNLPENGGQFAFLPKPFTLKQLVASVKETMSAA